MQPPLSETQQAQQEFADAAQRPACGPRSRRRTRSRPTLQSETLKTSLPTDQLAGYRFSKAELDIDACVEHRSPHFYNPPAAERTRAGARRAGKGPPIVRRSNRQRCSTTPAASWTSRFSDLISDRFGAEHTTALIIGRAALSASRREPTRNLETAFTIETGHSPCGWRQNTAALRAMQLEPRSEQSAATRDTLVQRGQARAAMPLTFAP